MAELQFPWVRTEMKLILEDLANPALQWEAWILKTTERLPQPMGFSGAAHFMLDDPWLGDDVEGCLGVILKTSEEVVTLQALVTALLAVITAVGKTATDREYLVHPLWMDVITAAREALDAFTRAEYGFPVKH